MANRDDGPAPFSPLPGEIQSRDLVLEKGLPGSLPTEKFILGAILLEGRRFSEVAESLSSDDFTTEAHRRIYSRMVDMHEAGVPIDRVTLLDALAKAGHLDSVGGMSALLELDDGIPDLPNIASYVRIVKEKSVLRKLIFGAQRVIDQALIGEAEPQALLSEAESSIRVLNREHGRKDEGKTPQAIIDDFGNIGAYLDPSQRARGLQTGFTKFDEMTTGLHPGEQWVVGGRTSQGKTAWALCVALYLVTRPKPFPVNIFSMEMSGLSLLDRLVCMAARVDQQKFRLGFLNQDERRRLQIALAILMDCPLRIYDSGITPEMVENAVRRDREKFGLALTIIDYIQLFGRDKRDKGDGNRNNEIASISRRLKMLWDECGIPGLVLSQVGRSSERRSGTDHRPQLADLRDSGAIEEDANGVIFLFREEVYKRDREDLKGIAEAIVAKQRNGPIGTVHLRFIGSYAKFENRIDDDYGPEEEPPISAPAPEEELHSRRKPYADD